MRLISDDVLIDSGAQMPVNEAVYPMLDEFKLWNPGAWTNGQPYDFYRKMRESAPVMWSSMGRSKFTSGFWSVSRYDDIKSVELAPQIYSSQRGSAEWAENYNPDYVWLNGEVKHLTLSRITSGSMARSSI